MNIKWKFADIDVTNNAECFSRAVIIWATRLFRAHCKQTSLLIISILMVLAVSVCVCVNGFCACLDNKQKWTTVCVSPKVCSEKSQIICGYMTIDSLVKLAGRPKLSIISFPSVATPSYDMADEPFRNSFMWNNRCADISIEISNCST